jgi:hypothetical protein
VIFARGRGGAWAAVGVGFTQEQYEILRETEDLYAMARLSDGIQLLFEK